MVAVDIFEVPASNHNNRFLLELLYKITLPSGLMLFLFQTKLYVIIAEELIQLFSRYGIPDALHL